MLNLTILRPYGDHLPEIPTILALISAQSDIDTRMDVRGDIGLPSHGYNYEESGIHIYAQATNKKAMRMSKLVAALKGVETLMTDFQSKVGIRKIRWVLEEANSGLIARGSLAAAAAVHGISEFNYTYTV